MEQEISALENITDLCYASIKYYPAYGKGENMTKKQFKEALLRGQGRCIQAVQADPAKYCSVVLWACSHEVAFDPQCEGTRSWFVYQLINCYQDPRPFLETAQESLKKARSNGGWKVLYLAELLGYFADGGARSAEQALWCKYDELYASVLRRKRPPVGLFHEKDDFAMLCQALVNSKATMLKIAEDIGRLYLTKGFYDGGDFDWLFASKAKQYIGTLNKQAQKSENISAYLHAGKTDEENWAQRSKTPEKYRSGRRLSLWLNNKADQRTVQEYAASYLMERDPTARAKALEAFSICPFPEDPLPIIEDSGSDFEPLKKAAWQALENIRHPSVHAFAMEQLDWDVESALPILITNYQPQDEELLVKLVKSIPVDFECTTAWHGIHLDILGMGDRGLKVPASLLHYIFESTYCSCCREYVLRQMGKWRLLDATILEECIFDSNDDIRTYARRCLNRRKRAEDGGD